MLMLMSLYDNDTLPDNLIEQEIYPNQIPL